MKIVKDGKSWEVLGAPQRTVFATKAAAESWVTGELESWKGSAQRKKPQRQDQAILRDVPRGG